MDKRLKKKRVKNEGIKMKLLCSFNMFFIMSKKIVKRKVNSPTKLTKPKARRKIAILIGTNHFSLEY
jgi:hypothetical protein